MAPAIVEKILHPNRSKEENASTHSLPSESKNGPVHEIDREHQVYGNPHQGNKHDKTPHEPTERTEHPVGFGQPGYPEGTPGQGPAGAGMMQIGS